MNLPQLKECVIIHYGCSAFGSPEHNIFWIGAIYHDPGKRYFFHHFQKFKEAEIIELFHNLIQSNKEKTFIHWSMNSPKFGFPAIADRYQELTGQSINVYPEKEIDLSEYLKEKYGVDYIERENGRLNNLAKHNGFTGFQSDIEVINQHDSANRLELIFSIVQAETQGKLKVLTAEPQSKKTKYESKFYGLAYIFDCIVTGKEIIWNGKKELEYIGSKTYQTTGNTFYKAVSRKLNNIDLNSFDSINKVCGTNRLKPVDWRELVLDIAINKDEVESYLKSKGLLE
ncbi:hypothetical protein E7Z59_13705 [Robertkochia marina]|uniref:Uncharacterized protein n=1 Tax=Robertkochia marina TaxID=1227945 RepID=A0A4S3LYX0_9FLAO|nr:hypothetical protein [Robertkochia marina]THD66828.1 hypothetical protein E7Z59_13705 [Robertkochia marina]TRZ40895.1 hypothetical protein D3A96_14835 [Robertkochia marina]